jgi:hypothetical protein
MLMCGKLYKLTSGTGFILQQLDSLVDIRLSVLQRLDLYRHMNENKTNHQ